MNAQANEVLDNIRAALETQLKGGPGLNEAEQKFCEDGLRFIETAGYALENFEECGPAEVIDALVSVASDDEALAPKVVEFFKLHGIDEAEADADDDAEDDDDGDDAEDESESKKKSKKK